MFLPGLEMGTFDRSHGDVMIATCFNKDRDEINKGYLADQDNAIIASVGFGSCLLDTRMAVAALLVFRRRCSRSILRRMPPQVLKAWG